jgi:hypothetical protein
VRWREYLKEPPHVKYLGSYFELVKVARVREERREEEMRLCQSLSSGTPGKGGI